MAVMTVTLPLAIDGLVALASSQHGPEGHLALPTSGVRSIAAHDHLRNASGAVAWLRQRREFTCPPGAPTADQLHTLREIRAALRDLARGDAARYQRRRERLLRGATFSIGSGALRPVATGWTRFAASFLPALVAVVEEQDRLKRCANELCGWLFVDRSKGHTRRWCDMNACGNRVKARRFRARHRSRVRTAAPS